MSLKAKAVEDLKKFSRMFNGWLELADEIEKLGSLEIFEKEILKRVSDAKESEKKAIESLSDIEGKLKAVEAHAEGVKSQAEEKAKALIDGAKIKADLLLAKASADSDKLLLDAKQESIAISESVESLKAQKVELQKEVSEEKAVLSNVQAQIKALKEMLK